MAVFYDQRESTSFQRSHGFGQMRRGQSASIRCNRSLIDAASKSSGKRPTRLSNLSARQFDLRAINFVWSLSSCVLDDRASIQIDSNRLAHANLRIKRIRRRSFFGAPILMVVRRAVEVQTNSISAASRAVPASRALVVHMFPLDFPGDQKVWQRSCNFSAKFFLISNHFALIWKNSDAHRVP